MWALQSQFCLIFSSSVNFFGDTINLLNFIGCCIVFVGVILYKIVVMTEKEEQKAKNAIAMEKDLSETEAPSDKERQPLHYSGDSDEGWAGVEMRTGPVRRAQSDEDIG